MHTSQNLHDVLIILAAAVLVVPIFKWLRSSPVLGYLVAGMLIGPSGLGIVSDISGVTILANFGVVFLLFTIGLELSIERLKAIRSHVFGLGTLQVVLTAGLFWLAARWLGQPRETAVILAAVWPCHRPPSSFRSWWNGASCRQGTAAFPSRSSCFRIWRWCRC